MLLFCRMQLRTRIMTLTYFLTLLRTHIAMKKFFLAILRPRNSSPYVTEMHDCFRLWNTIPTSPTFFPAARKECRPRKGRRPVIPP